MNAHLVVAIAVAATSSNVAANIIDRSVHRKLASAETVDVIVRFKPSVNVAQSFQEAGHANRGEHITALKAAFEKAHAEALSPLANLVSKESSTNLEVKTFWISPVASVKRATLADVLKIAALPNVVQVREARALALPDPIIQSVTSAENVTIPSTYEWGVGKIGANKVWTEGKTGEGVRVGAIDTGVRYTHEALRSNFGGNHSWFDPELKTALPHDDSGHGTHTMGTIAGTNGIGVAPGSTWLSCRGCRPDGCWDDDLLGCAQFVFCPTDPNGENADCSKAPRVINNSWGGGQGDDWYADAVAAWLKAGIVPVFSQGNAGPECVTALSSGDYANVIGVGATTSVDGLAAFSRKGHQSQGSSSRTSQLQVKQCAPPTC